MARFATTLLLGAVLALLPISAWAQQAQQAPQITGIGGFSDGVGALNGRWTGQPDHAPKTASNQFLGYLVLDTYVYPNGVRNPYYWDIHGQNFGTTKGAVVIARRPPGASAITITIQNWTDTRIRVLATASYSFTTEQVRIAVVTAATQQRPRGQASVPRDENVVAMVKSRGYGQCTWFVAHTRVGVGLAPPPMAYTNTAALPAVGAEASDYQPTQWDCLTYGKNHVAIIASVPTCTRNRDGTITWTFAVQEMNAAWDEVESSSQRTYKVSAPDRNGRRTVLVGIGTNASRRWVATGYYR